MREKERLEIRHNSGGRIRVGVMRNEALDGGETFGVEDQSRMAKGGSRGGPKRDVFLSERRPEPAAAFCDIERGKYA